MNVISEIPAVGRSAFSAVAMQGKIDLVDGWRAELRYRAASLVVVGFWVAALFVPYHQSTLWDVPGPATGDDPANVGLVLAEWGWLGPLALNVAWYANPLLVWMGVGMLRGRAPGRRVAIVALILACTALAPFLIWDAADGGFHPEMVSGPALWLWIAAFAIPAAMSRSTR